MPRFKECPLCGAHLDSGESCDCQKAAAEPLTYNGKVVFTQETFDYAEAQVGDYVEQAVVDDAMDCLPPASMSSACSQLGEPYSHREDPDTGKWRPTFATFKRITEGVNGIWQYCGHCFCGETVERGREPVYC